MNQVYIEIVVVIGIVILYFTMKNLLPSYFNEKGKNLATKEDIREITEMVENVKHSFLNETEKFKNDLHKFSSIHLSLVAEEKKAIIDYNEFFSYWFNLLTDHQLGNIEIDNNDEVDKYNKMIGESYRNFLNSETRFILFVENDELHQKSYELKLEVLKKIMSPMASYLMKQKENNLLVNLYHEQSQERIEQSKKKLLIYSEYSEIVISGLREIIPIKMEFQKKCHNYLYKLIEEKIY